MDSEFDLTKNCKMCGSCCVGTVPLVSHSDIKRWKLQKRNDILDKVETYFIWSRIPEQNGKCIFLARNKCKIYETRPASCKFFPSSKTSATKVNCKMHSKK